MEAEAAADAKGVAGAGVQCGALPRRLGLLPAARRHLATEPRSAGCRRSHVIARVSAALRAALSRPPSARQVEAVALPGSLPARLRVVGFWKKRRGELEETDRQVASCSATAASSGRRDGACSLATSPRRMGQESRQAGGDRVGLGGGRRSHETVKNEGCNCEATCHLDEEREQEQRLSPVSVMDFQSQQDGDDDCNDDGHSEDEGTSPTFEPSLANIQRSSGQQLLLQRLRRFEQLAELDTPDTGNGELDSVQDNPNAERGLVPEAGSPSPCPAHRFKKLLEDFFREGLSPCHSAGASDDPELETSLLETAKAWLDGRRCALIRSDQEAEVEEEIERLGRWRCFGEDDREPMSSDVECGIFCCLVEELVEDLC